MTRQDRRIDRERRADEQVAAIVADARRAATCGADLDDSTEQAYVLPTGPHRGGHRPTEELDMTATTTSKGTTTEGTTTNSRQPLTSREVAEIVGTDPKTLRRFLRDPRSTFAAAGQGGRYSFTRREATELKKKFTKWATDEAKAREARAAAKADKAAKAEKAPKAKASGKGGGKPSAPTFIPMTSEEKVDRLEANLRARGLHISQHR